jgi:hypothetical protein
VSITISETALTHRYLMNKSKEGLRFWLYDQKKAGLTVPDFEVAEVTKDWMAQAILKNVRAAEEKEAEQPQAYADLDIPLGTITTGYDGKRWVFCGWGQTTISKNAYLVRELQPGEPITLTTPWTYRCTMTDTLLKKFPELEQYRRASRP